MIPKIIHYCWLSDEEITGKYKICMDSWKKVIQGDYKYIHWCPDNFDFSQHKFAEKALSKGAYAFASDYIRIWALYYFGGIYFDCDVLVKKDISDLLNYPYVLGIENHIWDNPEAAVMMSEPGNPLFKEILDWYDRVEFTDDFEVLPVILKKFIKNKLKKKMNIMINPEKQWDHNDDVFNLFSKDFFSPLDYYTNTSMETDNTYTIHMFNAAWQGKFGEPRNRFMPDL